MKKIFFLALILFSSINYSQQRKFIKGKLLYKNTNVPAANVINNTAQFATITDSNGEFEIPVFEGDETFETLHLGMRQTFTMLVPLTVVREGVRELTGVLALGPRLSGMGYSSEDETLMATLVDSVSRALLVSELIEQNAVHQS